MFVGREPQIELVTGALDAARAGEGSAICFHGEAGIGKTTLLEAAVRLAPDFLILRTVGVDSALPLAHSGLADVVSPLRAHLHTLPSPQRDALASAVGWSDPVTDGQRFLVAAGTLGLVAAAAVQRPVLVVVDDLQWVDRESCTALLFAARRLGHDAVTVLMAMRTDDDAEVPIGTTGYLLPGLDGVAAQSLLTGSATSAVIDRLVAEANGNPLAMTEAVRALTPEQRRGSAPLPDVLPLSDRLLAATARSLGRLSAPGSRAMLLAAACAQPRAGHVVAALTAEGVDADQAVGDAERAGALRVHAGTLVFRHPLLRAAVWCEATPADQRSAHRALADALPTGCDQWVHHVSQATLGYDDDLALQLLAVAEAQRRRHGYASAAALAERAAELTSSPARAADARAAAVADAFLSGDMTRVRTSAAAVLAAPAGDQSRATALLWLGTLEQYAGSVHRARDLLTQAATIGSGVIRMRAVAELAHVGYRLGRPDAMDSAARAMAQQADTSDPEQAMLAGYIRGAALAFGGSWDEAYQPLAEALALLESEPSLRDEPRYLCASLLTAGWMGEPLRVVDYLDRRMAAARRCGALGVLPMALSLIAGGATILGQHQLAYASAGEAVELGTELGYVADVAIAHEVLAWQAAARGRPDAALTALAEARRLAQAAGVTDVAVHVDLVDAFAALCRGDAVRVIEVLERRLRLDEGRSARGDYPLGVAVDLVEAYVATGRTADATALADRHYSLHRDSPQPDVAAHAHRLRAMVAVDDTEADVEFEAAHQAHASGLDGFEAARTRLLHGSRLRRTGRRLAARSHLETAAAAFRAMGLDGWAARADDELAASGRTARRGPRRDDSLTSQETRVALLVATGQSNREIAASLFLSPKTVEHHVTSALRKRGLRSRTELAVAFATQQG